MWRCPSCAEEVEDGFDVCWNCGTSNDGTPDLNFQRVHDVGQIETRIDRPSATYLLTRQELGALICRGFALWIFARAAIESVSALALIVEVVQAASGDPYYPGRMVAVSGAMLCLGLTAIGTVVWKSSQQVGSWLVKDPQSSIHVIQVDGVSLLSIVCAVIGIWVIVSQMDDVVTSMYLFLSVNGRDRMELLQDAANRARICGKLIVLGAGCWLVFGSHGIATVIARLRSVPTQDDHVSGN
jgi:hypothetical protein